MREFGRSSCVKEQGAIPTNPFVIRSSNMNQRHSSIRAVEGVFVAVLCSATLQSTAVEAQKSFEGVITAESYVNRQTLTETLFVKGSRWRLSGFDPSRQAKDGVIVGDDKGQLTLWLPSRRAYMRQPVATDLDQAVGLVTFTKVGRSESVGGRECDYYMVQFKNSDAMDRQFCVATDLGFVGFTPEVRVHEGLASMGIGAVARRKFPGGFFVLKAIDKTGKVVFAATKVDRRSVGDDMFEPPAGWREAPAAGRPPQ